MVSHVRVRQTARTLLYSLVLWQLLPVLLILSITIQRSDCGSFKVTLEYPWLVSCRREGAPTEGVSPDAHEHACMLEQAQWTRVYLRCCAHSYASIRSKRTPANGTTLPAVGVDRPRGYRIVVVFFLQRTTGSFLAS